MQQIGMLRNVVMAGKLAQASCRAKRFCAMLQR
jgi:hypothetical protein